MIGVGKRVRYNVPAEQMLASGPWYPDMEGEVMRDGDTLYRTWVVRWDSEDVRNHIIAIGLAQNSFGDIIMLESTLTLVEQDQLMPPPWTL